MLRRIAEEQYKKTNLHEQYVQEQCAAKEREQKARIIVRNLLLQQIKIGKRRVAEEAGHERRMMLQFAHE